MKNSTPTNKKLRFKNKLYGRGWTPASREGRIILIVFLGSLTALVLVLADMELSTPILIISYIVCSLILLGCLIAISIRKGEYPHRSRGPKE